MSNKKYIRLASGKTLVNNSIVLFLLWILFFFFIQYVKTAFGNNLRLMILGSAPLAGNVLTFMRCALGGCLIVEGYGQTECTAPVSLTIYGDSVPEHVGPPVACCCVKVNKIFKYIYCTNGFALYDKITFYRFILLDFVACRCT